MLPIVGASANTPVKGARGAHPATRTRPLASVKIAELRRRHRSPVYRWLLLEASYAIQPS
jgi:hypothetical protein